MDALNRSWRCGSFVMLALAFSVSIAAAQNTSLASLQGTVTDESAAPMPGVTVNVTGPALQVPQISVVTDGDGSYRIENLPVGVYRVAYELTGFQSYIREDLRLTVGFSNAAVKRAASVILYEGVPGRNDTVTELAQAAEMVFTPPAGEHFYYARVTQEDGKVLWSAPVWVRQQPPLAALQ